MDVLLRPSTPRGTSPATVTRFELPGLAVIVVRCVVLGDAVVEQHELVRLPVDADHVLGAGDVGLEQPQDVLGFGVGQSRRCRWAKPPMKRPRSPVSGWTRTTGWAVSKWIRVNSFRRSPALACSRFFGTE